MVAIPVEDVLLIVVELLKVVGLHVRDIVVLLAPRVVRITVTMGVKVIVLIFVVLVVNLNALMRVLVVVLVVLLTVVLNVHISALQNALAVVKTVVKMDVLHAAEAVGVGVKLNVAVLAL